MYYYTFGYFLMAGISYFLNYDWRTLHPEGASRGGQEAGGKGGKGEREGGRKRDH
jgi:hypothetical protein